MLEEFQSHLQKEDDRRSLAENNLNRNSHIMVSVKAGVEHLADKLHHLKAVSYKQHKPTKHLHLQTPSPQGCLITNYTTKPSDMSCIQEHLKMWEQLSKLFY